MIEAVEGGDDGVMHGRQRKGPRVGVNKLDGRGVLARETQHRLRPVEPPHLVAAGGEPRGELPRPATKIQD